MGGPICRAAVITGAAVMLPGLAAGVASATGTRLATGAPAVSGGTWGKAEEVPGTATLNADSQGGVVSVSCATASSCSAGGNYFDSHRHTQAFVVSKP
jgi:hypothetical protein